MSTYRNDRGDRGNVGIIRSPVRASILPDLLVMSVYGTTLTGRHVPHSVSSRWAPEAPTGAPPPSPLRLLVTT